MGRFFVLPDQIKEEKVIINGSDVKHIKNVLRYIEGDNINICSEGVVYSCTIEHITADSVTCIINEKLLNDTELKISTVLYQGLPKGDKMDLIIQKNIELGITRIVPVIMERTIVRIEEKDVAKRLERWNRIALEAAKQCGRLVVPQVTEPIFFKDLSNVSNGLIKIMPYENEENNNLKDVLSRIKDKKDLSFDILIGPEGGISQSEVGYACECGYITVSLGKRILRTETAGFFVTGCIAYEFE